mgnify:FL=1
MNKPGVMIYFNMIPSSRLPDADRLRLYDAMMEYGRTGTEPEFDGPLGVAWDYVAPVLALDDNRYEQTRAKRSMAGKLSGIARRKKAEETTETDVQTQTNSVQSNSNQFSSNQINYYNHKDSFLAPTVEQVRQYAERENLPLDPTQFVDYYAANGWLLGKRPMRDWRAAARNWARKITAEAPKQPEIILAPLEDPYGSIVY